MRTLSAYIENNHIILKETVNLPNGLKVQVILPAECPSNSSGLCGIWQDSRTAEAIVEDILSGRTLGRNYAVFD